MSVRIDHDTNTIKFIKEYCRNELLLPLENIKKRNSIIKGYSKEFNCDVLINVDSIMSGKWVDFRSIIDKTQYFIDNYSKNGMLLPKEEITKRMSKIKCYSKEFNCDVIVDINSILSGHWIDFSNIINKTQYFIDNYSRNGQLIPIENIKKRKSKIICYSKEFGCNVLVNVHNILNGGWINFKSIIDKTQYFIDNFCKNGLLIPLEEISTRVSKIECYSKELDCNILVNVHDIMKGHWVISGWFHNMAKKYPNRTSYLYIVQLSHEDEIFYKVGVTTNKNKKRYKGYGKYRVNKEVIWIEDSAINISKMERRILRKCKSEYKPEYNFDGKSEIIDIIKFNSLNLLPENISI